MICKLRITSNVSVLGQRAHAPMTVLPAPTGQILDGMLRQGFLFLPSGKVFLSTAHTPADVEATADALDTVLHHM